MGRFENFIVGAYATSPTLLIWDRQKEIEYMNYLKDELNPIRGLELPFYGKGVHLHDSELFLELLDKGWEYVMTCLPGTMKSLESNVHFGLASDNESGRQEALKFYQEACKAVREINNYFSGKKVISVAIATSPALNVNGVSSSVSSLEKSLSELVSYDWDGAQLVIEHCDSGRVKNPVKGFLSIDEEIEAIKSINGKYDADIGITVNWARSAIEYRSEHGAEKHIKKLNDCDLLKGLMFSGTAEKESIYGSWTDLHLPVAKEDGISYYEEASLMSKKNITACLAISGVRNLDYLGVKVLSMPINESSLSKRIGINKDTMLILETAIGDLK